MSVVSLQQDHATPERLVVAMSGGVDSSVAAAILAREGYEVVGVTMQLSGDASRCCSLEDADDARRVADRLGIRFFVANYADRFRKEVIDAFADAYVQGRTPIPCVTCNSRFKFEHLMARAATFGADSVATGHYARIERDAAGGQARLYRARDRHKDQSYYLFELSQAQLRRARFPLGDMSKQDVRKLARELGLATADKAESQEICFVPDGDYAAVVERLRPDARQTRGEIVDRTGEVLAEHAGIHRFTIGQRHGLGIDHTDQPFYVNRIDPDTGRIVVGPRRELQVKAGHLQRVNWIAGQAPTRAQRACVQIRARHRGALAWVHPEAEQQARVVVDDAVEAFTPRHAAVFYESSNNLEVLGGGWIEGPLP